MNLNQTKGTTVYEEAYYLEVDPDIHPPVISESYARELGVETMVH